MKRTTSESSFRVRILARVRHDQLLKLREELGWSQRELADHLGISITSVVQWEGLKSYPKREQVMRRLCELAGSTPEELFPEFLRTKEFQTLPKSIEVSREVDPRLLLAGAGVPRLLPTPEESEALRRIQELVKQGLEIRHSRYCQEGEQFGKTVRHFNCRNKLGLKPQEVIILQAYFSEEDKGSALERLQKDLEISRSRINMIYHRALGKLRVALAKGHEGISVRNYQAEIQNVHAGGGSLAIEKHLKIQEREQLAKLRAVFKDVLDRLGE